MPANLESSAVATGLEKVHFHSNPKEGQCQKMFQLLWKETASLYIQVSSVQSLSSVRLFATPWITARQTSLSITNSRNTQTHAHWVSDAIQPSHPLSPPSPPAPNPSQHQGLFQWVSSSHQVAKVLQLSASASVFPTNIQDWSPLGWTGLISCSSRDSSLLQHQSSKASILRHSAFLIVQLSHPYMATGKTIALTRLLYSNINNNKCLFKY